jgi:L-ribulokinase
MAFTLGIDFGTNSARAVVVRCSDGEEVGGHVAPYPSGCRGILLDPHDPQLARQHPGDHLEVLQQCARRAMLAARKARDFHVGAIRGIGVDTTGSSPVPVNASNQPLALARKWRRSLSAQCWLWKDHTSWREAALITEKAARDRPRYLSRCGGTYSSEWFWSKIWHCLNASPEVFEAAHSWVELADWIPSILAGVSDPTRIVRGVCAAGHKAMYGEEWGGLPDKEFLASLHPKLADLRDRLYEQAYDARTAAGALCPAWSRRLGLPPGLPIAIGAFDVHYGSIACDIRKGTLVKVIGTSTCDCAVLPAGRSVPEIPGICGIVKGSILPGFYGIEAGQSAVGDIFNWWVERIASGPASPAATHRELSRKAALLTPGQSRLLALDWHNGNRTILVDPRLSGLLVGCSLNTTQAEIYRALIEATAFGARAIVERLRERGVPVRRIVCAGGIAEKNPLLMQIYADVLGCEIRVAGSAQTCAVGSAMAASVVAKVHPSFSSARRAMARLKCDSYKPAPVRSRVYDRLYAQYRVLHDSFGGLTRKADLSGVMKELLSL